MATVADIAELDRVARRLRSSQAARFPHAADLPALILVTDPRRIPDPVAAAEALPRGSMVIFRAFGAADAVETGRRLAEVARRRGLVLLAGADPRLARAIGARGVHLPERLAHLAGSLGRSWPGAVITAAAHSRSAIARAARAGVHAGLVSPVFESSSPSAGEALGKVRFASIARGSPVPVYALGGIDTGNVGRLVGTGACGIAAVSGLTLR